MKNNIYMAIFIVALFLMVPVSAALSTSEKVPVIQVAKVQEGVTFPITFSLESTDAEGDYDITVIGLSNTQDGNFVGVPKAEDTNYQSAIEYTYPEQTSIHMLPGATAKVNISVNPSLHSIGGLYGIICITQKGAAEGSGVNIPFIVTLKDTPADETGKVVEVYTENTTLDEIYVVSNFKNTGLVHQYGLYNRLVISNEFGEVLNVTSTPINAYVVPESTVQFKQLVNLKLNPGYYGIKSYVLSKDDVVFDFNQSASFEYGDLSVPRDYFNPNPTMKPLMENAPGTENRPYGFGEIPGGIYGKIAVFGALAIIFIVVVYYGVKHYKKKQALKTYRDIRLAQMREEQQREKQQKK
jgi:hypothetical protein